MFNPPENGSAQKYLIGQWSLGMEKLDVKRISKKKRAKKAKKRILPKGIH